MMVESPSIVVFVFISAVCVSFSGLQQQQAAGAGGRRRLHLSPQVPEPRFFVPKQVLIAVRTFQLVVRSSVLISIA
jgi:hypothetical protein